MKLSQNLIIDGQVVFKVTSIGNIEVYQVDSQDNDVETLYFVQGVTVLKKLTIKADSLDGNGYISDLEFETVSA